MTILTLRGAYECGRWAGMSEFIKKQQEMKANLIAQVRSVIADAEAQSRGLVQTDLETIERIEADITAVERSIETAQRAEERSAQAVEAALSCLQLRHVLTLSFSALWLRVKFAVTTLRLAQLSYLPQTLYLYPSWIAYTVRLVS